MSKTKMENQFMKATFKSILNVTWKVALAIIGIFVLCHLIDHAVVLPTMWMTEP